MGETGAEAGGEGLKRTIASRGVPSDETLYLPAYNSPEIRAFQDKEENPARNLWNMDEVANFLFSKKYQPKYYEISVGFLNLLGSRLTLGGDEISAYIRDNGVSKATFYNRVLPRLRKAGMVKVERETVVAQESRRKFRPMVVHLSRTFGNYLMKIGDSWLAIVDEARSRKQQTKL